MVVNRAQMWAHPDLYFDWMPPGVPILGFTDDDVCQVKNAWAAVGVYEHLGDADCDGIADEEESDSDGDHVPDRDDNCPHIPNGQAKIRLGKIWDAGDPEIYGDGILNDEDNCPYYPNPNQNRAYCIDSDNDGTEITGTTAPTISTPFKKTKTPTESATPVTMTTTMTASTTRWTTVLSQPTRTRRTTMKMT